MTTSTKEQDTWLIVTLAVKSKKANRIKEKVESLIFQIYLFLRCDIKFVFRQNL